jgi:heme/copper-type cytochrome/quinol oxidase subunit 4
MKTESARPVLQILFVLGMLIALGSAVVWFSQKQTGQAILKGFPTPGGNDWVTWIDDAEGVRAMAVHPIIRNNELLTGRYIMPGDLLTHIDRIPMRKAEAVNEIIFHSVPGKVLLFTVKREGSPVPVNLLITTSYLPRFSYFEVPALWSLYPWLVAIGSFLSLLSLLILFPVIRPELRENGSSAGVLLCGLLLFVLLFLRALTLLFSTDYSLSTFEILSTFICCVLIVALAVFYFHSRLSGKWKWAAFIPATIGILLLVKAQSWIFSDDFGRYSPLLIHSLLFFFALISFTGMLLNLFSSMGSLSRADWVFHSVALVLLGYLGWTTAPFRPMEVTESTAFLSSLAFLIPVLNTAASRLKFGRVSLVLSRSIQFALFALFSLVLYFLIHQTLSYLGLNFRYQPFLEVSTLILFILLFRGIYAAYEPQLRKYFVFALDRRREQFQQFMSRIPQYTSSRQLSEDAVRETAAYVGCNKVFLWLDGEKEIVGKPAFGPAELEPILNSLAASTEPWSQNPQLPSVDIPAEQAEQLFQWGIQLVFPLRVKENFQGLFLMGSKNRGVYNLDDVEQVSRLVQQTRLTLGVLHLLEQERILMEKNYQANLTALRSQINPHFLFNTLNTITSLIHDAPDEAEKATEKLAFIFRYTLKNSENINVTLGNEMSLVRTYLEIEHLRFGARLETQTRVAPELENLEIPAFVIQTVVENCIKHGIGRIIGKGIVQIQVTKEGEMAKIEIEDNGPGIDLTKVTSSTGLNNILSRLEKAYKRKNLLIFENTGHGTRVTIRIPLKPGVNV